MICGDFNFHVESNCSQSRKFLNLLDAFGLRQKVSNPTNDFGHTLDLVLEYMNDNIVSNVRVSEPVISDHKCVTFDELAERPKLKKVIC